MGRKCQQQRRPGPGTVVGENDGHGCHECHESMTQPASELTHPTGWTLTEVLVGRDTTPLHCGRGAVDLMRPPSSSHWHLSLSTRTLPPKHPRAEEGQQCKAGARRMIAPV